MPSIAILCVIGSYALRNNFFDVYVMFAFGMLGLAMCWLEIPIIPLLLAMVLGRQLEEHLRVSLITSKNDVSIFFYIAFQPILLRTCYRFNNLVPIRRVQEAKKFNAFKFTIAY